MKLVWEEITCLVNVLHQSGEIHRPMIPGAESQIEEAMTKRMDRFYKSHIYNKFLTSLLDAVILRLQCLAACTDGFMLNDNNIAAA